MRQKVQFAKQQPAVRVIPQGDKIRVFICINPVEVELEARTIAENETPEKYTVLEYDYNEFLADINLEGAIREAPESYLDYEPPTVQTLEERLEELENTNRILTECLLEVSETIYA